MKQFEPAKVLQRVPDAFFGELAKRVDELQNKGIDLINLGMGTPDQPTPDYIVRALQESAERLVYHQYPPSSGFPEVKEALAEHYQNVHGVTLQPDLEVTVLAGSNEGLMEVTQALVNPGDVVLLPDPGYPDYVASVLMAHGEPYFFPLLEENDFLPDYSLIPEEILKKAKVLVLNYPNNPTAAVATPELFEETVALAKKYDIAVVHDFAYSSLGFDGQQPLSFMKTPGAKDVGIETYTLSKMYNMTGWRIGFAVGNPSIIQHMVKIADFWNVFPFGAIEHAAAVALTQDQTAAREMTALYEKRRNLFVSGLQEIGATVELPKGAFYVWLKVPEGWRSKRFADVLLEKAHVVVAPGDGFGKEGEGYVRIGLIASEERLQEAVERIEQLQIFQ